jgi:V8-like Glu-specific endopeptidase
MTQGRKVWIVRAVIGLLVLILVSSVSAQSYSLGGSSVGTVQKSTIVTVNLSSQQQRATEAFWTRDRMLSARAMPLPVAKNLNQPAPSAQAAAADPVQMVSSTTSAPKMDQLARQLYPSEWLRTAEAVPAESEAALANTLADDPFTSSTARFDRYAVNYNTQMWQYHPFRAIGRLFFTDTYGQSASCSASVIANRGVITAGHCVYTPGRGWHTNVSFVPAYRYGAAPYGTFTSFSMATLSNWAANGARADDVAMVAVNDRNGYRVNQWVGNLGLAWNYSPIQLLHAFGYPANIGNTNYSSVCIGESWQEQAGGVIGMGCDMTYGSSGGPWVLNFRPYLTGGNFVNSVVSGGDPSIPKFYGPYFDTGNIGQLWPWVQNK